MQVLSDLDQYGKILVSQFTSEKDLKISCFLAICEELGVTDPEMRLALRKYKTSKRLTSKIN